jgi:hypothetical protein
VTMSLRAVWDDRAFTIPGNLGEQNRTGLLTVLEHEIGHPSAGNTRPTA